MHSEPFEGSAYQDLVTQAITSLDRAYTPYSHYQVGAALLDENGKIWQGCNIENAAYPVTICAERTALFKAVSEGVRSFQALAVVGRLEGEGTIASSPAAPCGVCRQALSEFCPPSLPIILPRQEGGAVVLDVYSLAELLPLSFGAANMAEE